MPYSVPSYGTSVAAVGHSVASEHFVESQLPLANELPSRGSLRDRARCAPLCLDEIVNSGPPLHHAAISTEVTSAPAPRTPPKAVNDSVVVLPAQTMSPESHQSALNLPRLLGNLHPNRGASSKHPHTHIAKQIDTRVSAPLQGSIDVQSSNGFEPCVPASPEGWPTLLTPNTLGNLRSSVQNTFVHVANLPHRHQLARVVHIRCLAIWDPLAICY